MKTRFLIITVLMLAFSGSIFSQEKKDTDSKRMKPALLVIDIQNAFLPMVEEREKGTAFYMTNTMIDLFRKEGYPVIVISHSDPENGPARDSEGFKFSEEIKILPSDPMVVKQHASGFKDTDLGKILKERNINTVFITGLSAVGCALATYIEAGDLGYNRFFVKYSLMSHSTEYTRDIEDIFSALDYETVKVMLENSVK